MNPINLKIPTQSTLLKQEQLIFISELLLMGYSTDEFLTKAFLFLSGLRVFDREPAADGSHWYTHPSRRKPFIIESDVLAGMAEKCSYLLNAGEIKPIKWLNFARARHYRLHNASFDEYLMAENYYFAYTETKRPEHLDNLISVLYRRPWHRWKAGKIRERAKQFRKVHPEFKNSVFLWYVGFRNLVPKQCPNLFSGKKSTDQFNVRRYINGMVHQLNNGNITLNKKLLKQSLWSALDELEQRAYQVSEIEKANNSKS